MSDNDSNTLEGAAPEANPASSHRHLGLIDASAIVISGCIGIGIFFSPATVLARAGSAGWALVAWGLGGLIAIVGGLCFAELGALRPRTGGQYRVLREAWGSGVGVAYAGTTGLIINSGSLAVLAAYATDFLCQAFGWKLTGADWTIVSLSWLAALAIVNWMGIRRAADLMDVLTLGKLITIAALGASAVLLSTRGEPAHAVSPFRFGAAPSAQGFLYALLPVLFATGGWQQVLWTAGDIKHPSRNIPRSLLIGITSVILAYFTVNAACLWLLGPERASASETVASDAMTAAWAGAGRWFAGAIGLSALGTAHVILMTASREQAAFGQTGDGPRWLSSIDPKSGAARRSVLALTCWSSLLLVIAGRDGINSLLDAVVMADFVFLGLGALSVLVLRKRHPNEARPFRCPGGAVLPLTFGSVAVLVASSPWFVPTLRPWAAAVSIVVIGLLIIGNRRAR